MLLLLKRCCCMLEWGLVDCNPVRVPVTTGTMTRLDDALKQELFYGKEECTEVRSLLGMLRMHWHAATTMPKLAVAHNLLAMYTATPVEGCMEALKAAARFVAGCKDECLFFGTGDAVGLKLFQLQTVIGLACTDLGTVSQPESSADVLAAFALARTRPVAGGAPPLP